MKNNMTFNTFFSPQINTQVIYNDECYYYMEDDKMNCVPYSESNGIEWDMTAIYDPNVGAASDALTAECNMALSILTKENV